MEIRSDVPMPKQGNSAPRTEHGKRLRELEVGQMMFDPDLATINKCRYLASGMGWKVARRPITLEGKKGWGLWRLA